MPKKSPNTNKTSKSKTVASTIKQQSKLKLGLLGLAAVLLLTLFGYLGLSAYKVQSLNAKAAGYRVLYHDAGNGYMIKACKIYTIYGYSLRIVANKPPTTNPRAGLSVHVNTKKSGYNSYNYTQTWWGNSVTVLDTPAGSNENSVSVYFYLTPNDNTGKWNFRTPATSMSIIPTC